MSQCYQLIDIQIKNDKTQARPIAWDRTLVDGEGNDEAGKPVVSIKFATTCPFCANLIEFNRDDLYTATNKSINNIKCETCGAANQKAEIAAKEEEEKKTENVVVAHYTTFRDPIAAGLFGEEIDFERLEKMDLAKSSQAV